MKRFLQLSRALQRINVALLLHMAYFLGIGIVSLVGRALGYRFLDESAAGSTCSAPTGSDEPERMY